MKRKTYIHVPIWPNKSKVCVDSVKNGPNLFESLKITHDSKYVWRFVEQEMCY